jgi:hypothetical protein
MLTHPDHREGQSFVRQVEAGLNHPDSADHWRRRAQARIRELQADRMDYGLYPDEQLELAQLERLVGKSWDSVSILGVLTGLAWAVAILVAIGLAG